MCLLRAQDQQSWGALLKPSFWLTEEGSDTATWTSLPSRISFAHASMSVHFSSAQAVLRLADCFYRPLGDTNFQSRSFRKQYHNPQLLTWPYHLTEVSGAAPAWGSTNTPITVNTTRLGDPRNLTLLVRLKSRTAWVFARWPVPFSETLGSSQTPSR